MPQMPLKYPNSFPVHKEKGSPHWALVELTSPWMALKMPFT